MRRISLEKLNKAIREGHKKAIIVNGATLTLILGQKELEKQFFRLCLTASTVICCRVSPAQKAQVTKLCKTYGREWITMAVGDGANDVSMIQEAHIGVGIRGQEGSQAVRASDFALSEF